MSYPKILPFSSSIGMHKYGGKAGNKVDFTTLQEVFEDGKAFSHPNCFVKIVQSDHIDNVSSNKVITIDPGPKVP